MATKVWRITRHGHHMSHAGRNITIASGADVLLQCFVRLHSTNINLAVEFAVPRLPEKGPRNECECHSDSDNHEPDIGLAGNLFAGRVKSHVSSIAVQAPVHVRSA
jgi:hypothetical protein